MKKSFLPFVFLVILCSSCCEDGARAFLNVILPTGPDPVCDSTKTTPYHDRFATEGYLGQAVVTDGSKVLLTSYTTLYWQDMSTGKMLRKIESPVAGKAFTNTDAVYRHGDLAVAASATGLAAFNVKTGELAWERALNDCDINKGVFGVDNQYFVVRKITEATGVTADAVFVGDLQNRDRLDLLFTPAYSRTTHNWAGYGYITAVNAFAGEDGHAYILIAFFEPIANSNALANFVGLLDATNQSWVYDHQPITGKFPNTTTGIHSMTIAGTSAYLGWEDKILDWDLAAGSIRDSMLLFNQHNYSYAATDNLWASQQYIIVESSNSDLQVFDPISHAVLYRIDRVSGTIRVELDLNRLFVVGSDYIDIYEISTGKKLQTIVAPCEQFTDHVAVWKSSPSVMEVVAAGKGGNMYRYIFAI